MPWLVVSCPKESVLGVVDLEIMNISLIRKMDMEVMLQDSLMTFEQICDLLPPSQKNKSL
jgi:hypothetical protein